MDTEQHVVSSVSIFFIIDKHLIIGFYIKLSNNYDLNRIKFTFQVFDQHSFEIEISYKYTQYFVDMKFFYDKIKLKKELNAYCN